MKDVMISIQPKWCELIANGKKTIGEKIVKKEDEVRKNRPKIDTPFKCYIYCTRIKDKKRYSDEFDIPINTRKWLGNGKVIGEFVCDKIEHFETEFCNDNNVYQDIRKVWTNEDDDDEDVEIVASNDNNNFENNKLLRNSCLTIDELKSYVGLGCGEFYAWHISGLKIYNEPKELSEFGLSRPPQSWCYVSD